MAVEYEQRLLAGAKVALESGNREILEQNLTILERTFANGSTAGAREVLAIRHLRQEGRPHAAKARARAFLAANPKAKERAEIEALVGRVD